MTSTTSTIRLASAFSGSTVFQQGDTTASSTPDSLPHGVDVVIVGATFAGIGAAIELAVQKHSVLVLEAEELGSDPFAGGLGRLHDELPDTATLPDDAAAAALLVAAASDADRWTKRVISEFGISCGYDPAAETTDIDPLALHNGLARVAVKHGASIRERTRVVRVKPAVGGGFDLRTSAGRLRAGQVLIADPAVLTALLPKAKVSVTKQPWAYLVTEPVPESVSLAQDDGLRVLEGRRLLASAAVNGSLSEARDELGARLFGSQPALQSASADGRELKILNAWQRTFSCTASGVPQAGEHDGVYYIASGSADDLSRMAWLGSRTARWMTGEAEPAFGVPPAQPKIAAVLAAVLGAAKAKAGR